MQKSRQVERAEFRAELKEGKRRSAAQHRVARKNSLLQRQSEREKAGFYTGRGTHASVSKSRSRIAARKVNKGVPHGRIIETVKEFGREFQLHATRGWRSYAA